MCELPVEQACLRRWTDYSEAFDCVDPDMMWNDLFTDRETTARMEHGQTEWFGIKIHQQSSIY